MEYIYEMVNTRTGAVEGRRQMTQDEKQTENQKLRSDGCPQRWIDAYEEDPAWDRDYWETANAGRKLRNSLLILCAVICLAAFCWWRF